MPSLTVSQEQDNRPFFGPFLPQSHLQARSAQNIVERLPALLKQYPFLQSLLDTAPKHKAS